MQISYVNVQTEDVAEETPLRLIKIKNERYFTFFFQNVSNPSTCTYISVQICVDLLGRQDHYHRHEVRFGDCCHLGKFSWSLVYQNIKRRFLN